MTDFNVDDWKPRFPNIPLLEPKIVSSWLGLPGSQLPRETMKIIGQAKQPAQKKGASARYSGEDAILMKLGQKLMHLGITPHRVRICVEKVRQKFNRFLHGFEERKDHSDGFFDDIRHGPYYLVGRESSTGFHADVVREEELANWLTESGIDNLERRMKEKREYYEKNEPKYSKAFIYMKLQELAATFGENVDPGSPAIVQNVTRFLENNYDDLVRHVSELKSSRK